jgi:hypothetical protein
MRTSILVVTFLLAVSCSDRPSGIEISNGQFNQLIKNRSIKNITFVTKDILFEIELTDSALADFKVQVDNLISAGRIRQPDDFRLFYLVADRDFAIDRIRAIERDNNLKPLEIKTRE